MTCLMISRISWRTPTMRTATHSARRTSPILYDPQQVARDNGIPLHSGAARYYRERGYLAPA